jgi:hypothetical protein
MIEEIKQHHIKKNEIGTNAPVSSMMNTQTAPNSSLLLLEGQTANLKLSNQLPISSAFANAGRNSS